ncbi:MAG: hypothetical protein NTY95_13620, partial [Bacteroidia bacterium]|nr:hypothetical protein [Bacteroidia bacterium]
AVGKEGRILHFVSGLGVLSLFVQRKNQRKGAGNEKFNLFVRLLQKALMAPPKRLNFAPFPICQRAISIQTICLFLIFGF